MAPSTLTERFVSAVHAGGAISPADWHAGFSAALLRWGVRLGDDGQLWRELYGGPLAAGTYRLLEPVEAREELAGAPWLGMEPCCPLVGPVVGFLAWTPFAGWDPPEAGGSGLAGLAIPILRESRGLLARLADDRIAQPVREVAFDLAGLASRWGFDDGERFLTREDGDYARCACRAAEEALRAAGLSGYVQWVQTSHNPLRLGWVELPSRLRAFLGLAPRLVPALWRKRDDRLVLVRNAERELSGMSVRLWAYDFAVAAEREFWEPVREQRTGT